MKNRISRIGLTIIVAWITQIGWAQSTLPVDRIRLPEGFTIEVYASGLRTARGLSFAPDGTLFGGTKAGEVYAVRPDGRTVTVTRRLNMPVGLDFFDGDLYISSLYKIV